MARKKGSEPSISSDFRRYFKDHPSWLKAGSNKAVFQLWMDEHPGQEITKSVRQAMANVKSSMKQKKRRGRPAKEEPSLLLEAPVDSRENALELLEYAIDDCLSTARTLDAKGLDKVISHLRLARNEIVLKMG
jgi:hypothetical protein